MPADIGEASQETQGRKQKAVLSHCLCVVTQDAAFGLDEANGSLATIYKLRLAFSFVRGIRKNGGRNFFFTQIIFWAVQGLTNELK